MECTILEFRVAVLPYSRAWLRHLLREGKRLIGRKAKGRWLIDLDALHFEDAAFQKYIEDAKARILRMRQ